MTERRTGKTMEMVKVLPETGAVVIVHSAPLRRYVEAMILDLRGPDVRERCDVRSVHNLYRAETAMQGRSGPFAFDHAFWEHADRQTAAWVRAYLAAVEARAA